MLISISGSSGVGKTTLTSLIELVHSKEEIVSVHGDDLHRWERTDPKWEEYTHLHPDANDLELGYEHLRDLCSNKEIYRSCYDHDTGKFISVPRKIEPKNMIVYEGLHALYHEKTNDLSDIRIFVDTVPELKNNWKMKRDTKKRGYTKEQVLTVLERRKNDEAAYIDPQKANANVVVRFWQSDTKDIHMSYTTTDDTLIPFMDRLVRFYNTQKNFLKACQHLSTNFFLCQSRGGNVSIKNTKDMIITSSGTMMNDVHMFGGFSICEPTILFKHCDTDAEYLELVKSSKIDKSTGIPSMELGMHRNIQYSIVVHTHPIYLNAILCTQNSEKILREIFGNLKYQFVKYKTPGRELSNRIGYMYGDLFFLENHGLIVAGENMEEILSTTDSINNACQKWLESNMEGFVPFSNSGDSSSSEPEYLFPDAVVLPNEMMGINRYILGLIRHAGLEPKFLTSSEIKELKEMEFEKYRSSLK